MKAKAEFCNMPILLLAATPHEIMPQNTAIEGVDLLIGGVGVPATMYHLQKRLQQMDYDLVIQAGIAGVFDSQFQSGETVLVERDCFGDLGTEEKGNFSRIFEAGLGDANEFPFEEGWLVNPTALSPSLDFPKVKAVTVNKVTDDPRQKKQLADTYAAAIESMEGAALHYICLQEKIPFVQIRTISNEVGERDKTKWKMKEAIDALNRDLLLLIDSLRKNKI